MAAEKWTDEQSALFVAEVNTRVLVKAIAWLFGCMVVLFASVYLFGDTSISGIAFALSLVPMYPMMEYVVVLMSVMNKLNLNTGRNVFFANRAAYRAKLKANPEARLYKPTRNHKLIAWGIVAVLVVALAAAMQN